MAKVEGPNIGLLKFKDIEEINRELTSGAGPDIAKISFPVYPKISKEYNLLSSGAIIVQQSGPKIVSMSQSPDISSSCLLVPGKNTTAYLLASSLMPKFKSFLLVPYHKIIQKLKANPSYCGLLIHESSFEIKKQGFFEMADLYDLWYKHTDGLPLPLGGIAAKKA